MRCMADETRITDPPPVIIGSNFSVDPNLASPVRSLGELILQPERDGQDDNLGFERILQRARGHRRSNRRGSRRDRLGRPPARHGHSNVFTGERLGKRLADGAKTCNRRAQEILRIAV
jgi:hypothetical protein